LPLLGGAASGEETAGEAPVAVLATLGDRLVLLAPHALAPRLPAVAPPGAADAEGAAEWIEPATEARSVALLDAVLEAAARVKSCGTAGSSLEATA
jgi:hypothetical protein